MKILLSAYACEPNKGSEPGVGWNWAIELSRLGHDVWVLTRANNQLVIEKEFKKTIQPKNLQFIYYDLPVWTRIWKKGNRGVYLYYFLWQYGAFRIAKKYHKEVIYDLVHHITFGVIRQPSFMGFLKIPFIFGPVGGGERAPIALRKSYPIKGKILDFLRDILNVLARYDPLMRFTFNKATIIYTKTPDSAKIIPLKYKYKVRSTLEIGINDVNRTSFFKKNTTFKILFVGRFVYWKGMHLGIKAFSKVIEELPNVQLTMVGKGPEKELLVKLSKKCNAYDRINWVDWVDHNELATIYQAHDIFLFPSLHDSSGNVLLEALSHGLPVICFDLGGPGVIVDNNCGVKITTKSKTEEQVIKEIGMEIFRCATNSELMTLLREGSYCRANNLKWEFVVNSCYEVVPRNKITSCSILNLIGPPG